MTIAAPPIFESPSPNHGGRAPGAQIRLIVLHADVAPSADVTRRWLARRDAKASYHVLAERDGTLYRLVADERRAWHAGVSAYNGVKDVNDFSLGLCFSNRQDGEPFTPKAIEAGARLIAWWCQRHGIPIEAITTHEQIARPLGRKSDPGPLFPYLMLVRGVRNFLTEDS